MRKGVDYIGVTTVFICHDGQGNFLLAKRSNNTRDEHGCWDCGGGALDFGDHVIDNLKNEIKEEYNADVLEHEFMGHRDVHREHNGEKTHWVALDFKVLVNPEKVKNNEPHKFDKIGWFRLGEFPKPLHSQLEKFLEKYKSYLEK